MAPHNSSPRHAVALSYEVGDGAPKVSAKGYGPIADEIIRRAQEAGVYVHESRELVQLLMQVDLDAHIPPDLYRAIAVLLAWIYRAERNLATPNQPLPDLIGLIDKQEST